MNNEHNITEKIISDLSEGELLCSRKIRIYPTQQQLHYLEHWLVGNQQFRNEAVKFLADLSLGKFKQWIM